MRLLASAAPVLACACAFAAPRESITFPSVDGNGVLNSPANSVRLHQFAGGYPLGRITFSGTLTSVTSPTWRSDAKLLLTAPDGSSTVFRPFPTGGPFTTLPISGQAWVNPGMNPAGTWTLRFFEEYDDGGTARVDAVWNVTITTTDEPPAPPPFVNAGVLSAPGVTLPATPLPSGGILWYRFQLTRAASGFNALFLDVDTLGSTVATGLTSVINDTLVALYDASGNFLMSDDDSGDHFLSALSFGPAGRPPTGDGQPFDGRNGSLPAGTYFLAVAGFPLSFSPYWSVVPLEPRSGSIVMRMSVNNPAAPPCTADFNADGSSDFFDYLDFVAAFDAEDIAADVNASGSVDFFDYLDFVAALEVGC